MDVGLKLRREFAYRPIWLRDRPCIKDSFVPTERFRYRKISIPYYLVLQWDGSSVNGCNEGPFLRVLVLNLRQFPAIKHR
jgi:hypothetical protein